MKIIKELKEQYAWLWWWLLDQGIFLATMLVNAFLFVIWVLVMALFYFVMKWISKH